MPIDDLERIFRPADAAQADAVRSALAEAGLEAHILIEDAGDDTILLEIAVPRAQAPQARAIIAKGNWPRLA